MEDLDNDKLNSLLKIKHEKSQFIHNGWVNLDSLYLLVNKYIFDEESSPVVIIDKIESDTIEKINTLCKKIKK